VTGTLGKVGQIVVVVAGFFATLQMLTIGVTAGTVPMARAGVTLAFALGLALRYWWVILLLPWPARWPRMLLILLAWSAMPLVAASAANVERWALVLAALSAIGCATEIYNGITRQWMVGSDEMTRSLRHDHVIGAVGAGAVAIALVVVEALRPEWLDALVALLVVADWLRLVVMLRRHQHFIDKESPT
jgi:hypothetical protein